MAHSRPLKALESVLATDAEEWVTSSPNASRVITSPVEGSARNFPNPITSAPTEDTTVTTPDLAQRTKNPEKNKDLHSRGENVADSARIEKASSIKNKFSDIIQVNADCESIDVDLENYTDDVNVAASLSKPASVEFFRKIGASGYILATLTNGHKSTLTQEVPSYERRNNISYQENEAFAVKEVFELARKGKVQFLDKKPHIVNPFSVAVQRTKSRLILDCSYLNQFVDVPKFKYEDAKEALNFFKKGCSMIKWDLKNGYHLIKIHKDFRKYLGFKIEHEGKIIYGCYLVGPFGLRDLPYLFTKIFRPLVRHWRSVGLAVVKFLDDGICFSDSDEEGEKASRHIRKDLFQAGAFWSVKKSTWTPTKFCEWLGFSWDSNECTIAAAPHRITKIKELTSLLLSKDVCPIKKLASFTGQIISLSEVVGNCSRLTTRCSQIAIAEAPSWNSHITITPTIKEEIKFWRENIDSLNIKCCFLQKPPNFLNIIESDASDSGCGSILNYKDKALRLFSTKEQSRHSTFRELTAVAHALESFLPSISHSKVKVKVDNQSAARIIDVGSMKSDLHLIAMNIFFLCLKNGISLEIEWIPRELNEAADAASREAIMVDTDDWQITDSFFKLLNGRWGPLTIDCFANYYNKKIDRFYSLFNSPGCEGVDAFSYNWKNENCLLVPPVCVVGMALRHLRLCKARGVLVVPYWPSAAYWPLLLNDFHSDIKDFLKVKGKNVLRHGLNENSLLGSDGFLGNMIAISIDCS